MKIRFVDVAAGLVQEWGRCAPEDMIECVAGDIFAAPTQALVSPANSFGFMDGGIDMAYSTRLGWHVQNAVQSAIVDRFDGELLVGQALSVETGNADFPYVIAAPTMRVNRRVDDPQAVRLATRAAMREAIRLGLDEITFPGMGTGCGCLRWDWAAPLMVAGIMDALNPKSFPKTLREAWQDHHAPYPTARAA